MPEEYRAQNQEEQGTPQAPLEAGPETSPVKDGSLPDGDQPPVLPQKSPEQRAQEEAAEFRRKYQESEGKVGLLQQQMQFTQQQLQTLMQQQTRQAPPQEEQMPEFEDPQQALKWMHEDLTKKHKAEVAALKKEFEQTQRKTEAQQVAQRVVDAYPDIMDQTSQLHLQFKQECYQRGVDPNNPDPFTLEAASAIAAAKVGVLPRNVRQLTGNSLPKGNPPLPWNGERIPQGKPKDTVVQLTSAQIENCRRFGTPVDGPNGLKEFIKRKNYRFADGRPVYKVS